MASDSGDPAHLHVRSWIEQFLRIGDNAWEAIAYLKHAIKFGTRPQII
jgi:hypothetical protein